MKRLLILRHAKSDWADAALSDFDRPLNERGRGDGPKIARALAASGWKPTLALVSSARRTRETWGYLAAQMKPAPKPDFRRDLYLAEAESLLHILRADGGAHEEILLIGHNPGLEDLALLLAKPRQKAAGAAAFQRIKDKFPTGSLATLEFEIDGWPGLKPGSGDLIAFTTPRDL